MVTRASRQRGSRCHRPAEEPMTASPSSSSWTSWWRGAYPLHDLVAWGAAAAWDLAVGEPATRGSSRVPESSALQRGRRRPCSNHMEKVVVTTVACRGRPWSSPAARGFSSGPRRLESPNPPSSHELSPVERLQRRSMHTRGRRRCSSTMPTLEETCDGVHIGFLSATAAPPAPKRCCGCSAPATAHTKPEKLGLHGPARNFIIFVASYGANEPANHPR